MNNKTSKDRRTEVYILSLEKKITGEVLLEDLKLEDILKGFFKEKHLIVNKETKNIKNTFQIEKSDLTYFFHQTDVNEENDIISVKFTYLVSNRVVNIVDLSTMETTGKKSKNEGDEEKQHIIIKLLPGTSTAILVYEKIPGAITLNSLKEKLNNYLKISYGEFIPSTNAEIMFNPMPDEDFLADLTRAKSFNVLTLYVDRNKITTDPDFLISGNDENVREVAEITYKPNRLKSFSQNQIAKLYETHKTKPHKLSRIVVHANGENGKIRLDTEGAKMAKYISANLDINGLVDTDDIFSKYKKFVDEIPTELLSICIQEVAADCEE